MKEIPLTRGRYAIVDDDDFEELNKYKWYCGNNGYAMREKMVKRVKTRYMMHRVIINAPDDKFVDHINGNPLDNRKENLRLANKSQNGVNRPVRIDSKTGFKGVSFKNDTPRKRPYGAYIKKDGKKVHLGHFETPEEAARAYDKAALEQYGEFAYLNFKDESL